MTFVVILLTLLLQGLTLPYVIRKIGMPEYNDTMPEEEMDTHIRRLLAEQALLHLNANYSEQLDTDPVLKQMISKWEGASMLTDDIAIADEFKTIHREVLQQQRSWLLKKNKDEKNWDEEIVRKHLQQLDLEEEKLRYL